MEPKFNAPQGGYDAELLCPSCGGNFLHHERVEVFERAEDQKEGLHISISEGAIAIDTNIKGNPSIRRQGLSIYFRCEECSATSIFKVQQHKGSTFVDFTFTNEAYLA